MQGCVSSLPSTVEAIIAIMLYAATHVCERNRPFIKNDYGDLPW